MPRITSIDIVRGLVMLIMAIDHIRDLMHVSALGPSPTDLTTTTPALFFTRWITYFCAPIFVFLAGTSAYLGLKNSSVEQARKFLLTRGLWLIVLEFTIITFGIWWDIHFQVLLFQVIAAIGLGFVILSWLLKVPARTLGFVGLFIIAFHGLMGLIPLKPGTVQQAIGTLLFGVGLIPLGAKHFLLAGYAIIPWLGVLLTGYGWGDLFERDAAQRKSLFWKIGLAVLAAFVLLRLTNLYGDPAKWAVQKDAVYTVLSFLNVSKYPPSLLFCTLTLGVMFLLLALVENWSNWVTRILQVYGKVPLFYYLLHWYLIHSIMFIILFAQGFGAADFKFGFTFGRPEAPNGLPLWGIYLVWIGVVVVLYPLCKWYGKYKAVHVGKWWLRYL